MSAITDLVQQHLGDNGVAQIAQHLGVDPATAQAAVAAALPMLVGAVSARMGQPGAAAVTPATPGSAGAAGGGLLGSIFGDRHPDASQQVSSSSGLDIHQAEKALLFLAPIVMAQLAKRQQAAATPAAPGQPVAPAQAQSPLPNLGSVIGAVEGMFKQGS